MNGIRLNHLRNQRLYTLAFFLLAFAAAYVVAGWIIAGATENLLWAGLALAAGAIFLSILNNWRSGFYFFLIWLLFEDLVRKYMGNNMAIYFGKDVLVGVCYVSFFVALRRGEAQTFRPRFFLPLMLFFWLGFLQVFNPYSPSMLYGFLGLKLYFYYVPLMFVGYALVDSEPSLHKFLMFNLKLAVVIALLGAIQAVRGPEFLNPVDLAPDIRALSTLRRVAPLSGEVVYRPTSVFVSDGRFGWYLILMWLVAFGAAGYLLLKTRRSRNLAFLSFGVITATIPLTGSRGALLWTAGSALITAAAFVWGAPWKQREAYRIVRAIQRAFLVGGLAVLCLLIFYPQAIGARFSFYSETLNPSSPSSELQYRTGEYPFHNLMLAFQHERWPYGYGIGTASLGRQYVSRIMKVTPLPIGVENGFGTLIIEFGILGLALWLAWTAALLLAEWRVVRKLKGTPYFPIAFSIFWFSFLLLLPFTYMGMAPYQNFILNAYLWLLVGVLFRLPALAGFTLPYQVTPTPARAR